MNGDHMTLQEATNIGNQLVAMGRITHDQLCLAQRKYKEATANGRKLRFGDVLLELGMVKKEDLDEAERRQQVDRDIHPSNRSDTEDALKILRQTAHAFKKSTSARLAALSEPATSNGHSNGIAKVHKIGGDAIPTPAPFFMGKQK